MVASRLLVESNLLLCMCCALNCACAFVWESAKLVWAKMVSERTLTAWLKLVLWPCFIYYYRCGPERSDECESQHRRDGAVWLEMKKGEGRCRADNVRELRKGYPFDVRELLHYLSWLA